KSATDNNIENLKEEKIRRVIIQTISFFSGTLTAIILSTNWFTDSTDIWNYYYEEGKPMNVFVLGVLSSAGSVFWTQILGYSKAIKDVKKQEAQIERAAASRSEELAVRRATIKSKYNQFQNESQPDIDSIA